MRTLWSAGSGRSPKSIRGTGGGGSRRLVDAEYRPFSWRRILDEVPGLRKSDNYLVASIRSFVDAVREGSELWISGHDLRQALEVAIACKVSALQGNRPVELPLKDRSLALYPRPYRWLGGDATENPQSLEDAAGGA